MMIRGLLLNVAVVRSSFPVLRLLLGLVVVVRRSLFSSAEANVNEVEGSRVAPAEKAITNGRRQGKLVGIEQIDREREAEK